MQMDAGIFSPREAQKAATAEVNRKAFGEKECPCHQTGEAVSQGQKAEEASPH